MKTLTSPKYTCKRRLLSRFKRKRLCPKIKRGLYVAYGLNLRRIGQTSGLLKAGRGCSVATTIYTVPQAAHLIGPTTPGPNRNKNIAAVAYKNDSARPVKAAFAHGLYSPPPCSPTSYAAILVSTITLPSLGKNAFLPSIPERRESLFPPTFRPQTSCSENERKAPSTNPCIN